MADEKLVVGDVVVLKSGSPEMTIHYIDSPMNQVYCKWFDGKKLSEGIFSPQSLKKVG